MTALRHNGVSYKNTIDSDYKIKDGGPYQVVSAEIIKMQAILYRLSRLHLYIQEYICVGVCVSVCVCIHVNN